MIRGKKVYTTRRMQAGDRLDVALPEEASSEHIVPTVNTTNTMPSCA